MGYYDFPHTRNYDTDLGYLITQYLNLREEVNTLLASQTITYADPLQWNITTQYAKNYIVINGYNAYLSKQPVPAGILITNTDYWLTVGDFIREFEDLRKNIASADEGSSTTATANRTKGSLVWLENTLYKVLSNINTGDAYVVDSNIQLVTIEQFIDEMVTTIDNLINNLTIKLNQEVSNREIADESTLQAANTYTDNKINQLGQNPRIVCITDSYGTHSTNNWMANLKTLLNLTDNDYFSSAEGSSGFTHEGSAGHTFLTQLQSFISSVTYKDTITAVIFGGGTNDFYYFDSQSTLETAITNTITYAKSQFPNAKIYTCFMGYVCNMSSDMFKNYLRTINIYQNATIKNNGLFIDAINFMHSPSLREDTMHPNDKCNTLLANKIYSVIKGTDAVLFTNYGVDDSNNVYNTTWASWLTKGTAPLLIQHIINGTTNFTIGQINGLSTTGTTISVTNPIEICSINNTTYNTPQQAFMNIQYTISLYMNSDYSTTKDVSGILYFERVSDSVTKMMFLANDSTLNSTIYGVRAESTTINIPTLIC